MKLKLCEICENIAPCEGIRGYLHFIKDLPVRILRRIPRRAYQVYCDGIPGYVTFDKTMIDEERNSCDAEDAELFTMKRVWISPAELYKACEFGGW